MSLLDILLSIAICGAVCAIYVVGSGKFVSPRVDLEAVGWRISVKRTSIELVYRNANGLKSQIRTTVVKAQRYADGRLILLGVCGAAWRIREFRADRIESLTVTTGEPVDLAIFLTQRLGIPNEVVVVALQRRQPARAMPAWSPTPDKPSRLF